QHLARLAVEVRELGDAGAGRNDREAVRPLQDDVAHRAVAGEDVAKVIARREPEEHVDAREAQIAVQERHPASAAREREPRVEHEVRFAHAALARRECDGPVARDHRRKRGGKSGVTGHGRSLRRTRRARSAADAGWMSSGISRPAVTYEIGKALSAATPRIEPNVEASSSFVKTRRVTQSGPNDASVASASSVFMVAGITKCTSLGRAACRSGARAAIPASSVRPRPGVSMSFSSDGRSSADRTSAGVVATSWVMPTMRAIASSGVAGA